MTPVIKGIIKLNYITTKRGIELIKRKICLVMLILIFGVLSTLVYMLIDCFELKNDLGVILGFLLAFGVIFFSLFLDLLLSEKKVNERD